MKFKITKKYLSLILIILTLSSCSLLNTFDDSKLNESDSAFLYTQNYLSVFAYKKRGLDAAEDPIGNLKWKTKIPEGLYRLEVSFDKPGVGKSFVPVSVSLDAKKGKKYWLAYDQSTGFFSNSWRPAIVETEPSGFYGILEFWKKD
jgi:hypothetical protein